MEIQRTKELQQVTEKFQITPIVAILGPRQCGKTTLARQLMAQGRWSSIDFFDLENPTDLARLDNPMLALKEKKGLVVIDEIQRRADLFPVLRVLVDRQKRETDYLILGSASRDLIRQSSESLAGRMSYFELSGFSLNDVAMQLKRLWNRGSFPLAYLAKNDGISFQWRQDFIQTFLERDIPNLGIHIPAKTLHRFWMMLAHYHGQIFAASSISRSLGSDEKTARKYLDLLTDTFMLRQLQPWFYNTKKRLVKRPKVYFRDSGLFHALLSIQDYQQLEKHPQMGASWEGFVLEQIIRHLGLRQEEAFFWGVHTGPGLDLLFQRNGKMWGIEVKFNEAPLLTKSMQSALEELSLQHLWIVYPGEKSYLLHSSVTVVPLQDLKNLAKDLMGPSST